MGRSRIHSPSPISLLPSNIPWQLGPAQWNGVRPSLGSGAQVHEKRSPHSPSDTRLVMEPDLTEEEIEAIRTRYRRSLTENRRNSLLPFQWRIIHSSRWVAQVVASEFSLVGFLLLLVMVFSKKWLYPSKSRFHQRYPKNITNKVYTSIHRMSTGLLYICTSRSCSSSDSEKDIFKLWTLHPILGVAKLSFILALGLGFALTTWLHLPYLPRLQRMPSFGLIGIVLSFCEVTFIFLTLLLFPVNLWIYELERNVSIPIGWTYFIGWLVLVLYCTCGILCYLNHKNFWSLIMSSSSSITSPCNSTAQGSLMSVAQSSSRREDILDLDKDTDNQKPLDLPKCFLTPCPATIG